MAKVKLSGEWFWRGAFLSPGIEYEMTDEDRKTLQSVGAPLIEQVKVNETAPQQRGRNRGKG